MTEFHIEPANEDGSPDETTGINTWCVMHLGAKIASTSSPDLAKRMRHFFETQSMIVNMKLPENKFFEKGDLSAEIFSETAELFMLVEDGWKPVKQPGNTLNQSVNQSIKSGNKNK